MEDLRDVLPRELEVLGLQPLDKRRLAKALQGSPPAPSKPASQAVTAAAAEAEAADEVCPSPSLLLLQGIPPSLLLLQGIAPSPF